MKSTDEKRKLPETGQLRLRIIELEQALARIAKWNGEFPKTKVRWPDGTPMSFGAAYGSVGERDYMRKVAEEALKE